MEIFKSVENMEYEILSCVETHGANYINTGVYLKNIGKVQTRLSFSAAFDYNMAYGMWPRFCLGMRTGSISGHTSDICYGDGNNSGSQTFDSWTPGTNVICDIEHTKTQLKITANGTEHSDACVDLGPNSGHYDYPFFLFGASAEGSVYRPDQAPHRETWQSYGKLTFYYMRIYDLEGALIRWYIPVRRTKEGQLGIYDLVNKEFVKLVYDSDSSLVDSLTMPESASLYRLVDYIDFQAGQYIDLGFKPTETTGTEVKFRPTNIASCFNGSTQQNQGTIVYGAAADADTNAYELYSQLNIHNGIECWEVNMGSYGRQYIGNFSYDLSEDGNDIIVRYDQKQTTIAVDDKKETLSFMSNPVVNIQKNLYLGALNRNSLLANKSRLRVYYFDAWTFSDGALNTPKRHMLPCVKISGESVQYGMFDFIEIKFYELNASTPRSVVPVASLIKKDCVCNDTNSEWQNSIVALARLHGDFEVSWRIPYVMDCIFIGLMTQQNLRVLQRQNIANAYEKYDIALYQYGDCHQGGDMYWYENGSFSFVSQREITPIKSSVNSTFKMTRYDNKLTFYLNNFELKSSDFTSKDLTFSDEYYYLVISTCRAVANKVILEDVDIKYDITSTNKYTIPSLDAYENVPVEYIEVNRATCYNLSRETKTMDNETFLEDTMLKGNRRDCIEIEVEPSESGKVNSVQAVCGGRGTNDSGDYKSYQIFYNVSNSNKYRLDIVNDNHLLEVDNPGTKTSFYLSKGRAYINGELLKANNNLKDGIFFDGTNKYQSLEYIQSNGTQYINTLYSQRATTRIKMEVAVLSSTEGTGPGGENEKLKNYIFGSQDVTNNSYPYYTVALTTHGEIGYEYGGGQSVHEYPFKINLKQRYRIDYSDKFTINDTTIASGLTFVESSYNIYLFGDNLVNTFCRTGPMRVYYCQIFEGGELVRNFVPCKRISDKKVGMYDLVGKQFYYSPVGNFKSGPACHYSGYLNLASEAVGSFEQPLIIGSLSQPNGIDPRPFCGRIGPVAAYINGKNHYWIPVKRQAASGYGYYYYNVSHFNNGDQKFIQIAPEEGTISGRTFGDPVGCGEPLKMYNYQQLDYIELTGGYNNKGGQYFDTKYVPNEYCKVTCTVEVFHETRGKIWNHTSLWSPIFGRRSHVGTTYGSDTHQFNAWYNVYTGESAFNFGVADIQTGHMLCGKQTITVETNLNKSNQGIYYIDNREIARTSEGNNYEYEDNHNTPFYIGTICEYNGTSGYFQPEQCKRSSSMRLYEFLIYEKDLMSGDTGTYILARKYTPARNLFTGEVGLYEWYTGEFLTAIHPDDVDVRPGPSTYPAVKWN